MRWLDSSWILLATYPLFLALAITVVGIGIAGTVRAALLFWGLKLTRRTCTPIWTSSS